MFASGYPSAARINLLIRLPNLHKPLMIDGNDSETLGIPKMDRSAVDIVFSIILTWGWGLAVPLILRYAVLKRAVEKVIALFIAGGLWLLNIFIFTALGSQSRTHAALLLVAAVSYWILTRKPTPAQQIGPVATTTTDVPPSRPEAPLPTSEPQRALVDNGFKGKRIYIFLVATAISALLAAVFGKTSSNWFLFIPVLATFFSVLVVGQPESTRNWRNTIVWSLPFTPVVLIVSFFALGIIINLIE